MRTGNAALKPEPLGFIGECFDVTRHRIVRLVAMHVDHQPPFSGDFAQPGDRPGTVVHGALEVWDAANNVDTHVQRSEQVLFRVFRTVEAILRKGDQL